MREWKDGDTITAEDLNQMVKAIEKAQNTANEAKREIKALQEKAEA